MSMFDFANEVRLSGEVVKLAAQVRAHEATIETLRGEDVHKDCPAHEHNDHSPERGNDPHDDCLRCDDWLQAALVKGA